MTPFPLRLKESQISSLTSLSAILHLLHYRNSNQHHSSPFYRHFLTFRHHFSKILTLYVQLNSTPSTFSARHRKRIRDVKNEKKVQSQVKFFAERVVPNAWRAFTQVVADGRWCLIGMVLLSALGEVCRVFGVSGYWEEKSQEEMREVLRRFEQETWNGKAQEVKSSISNGGDVGEVVKRSAVENRSESVLLDDTRQSRGVIDSHKRVDESMQDSKPAGSKKDEFVRKSTSTITRIAKSKRKDKTKSKSKMIPGDAIDDIFAGL